MSSPDWHTNFCDNEGMSQRGYSGISHQFRNTATDTAISPGIKKSVNKAVISVPAL